MSFQPANPAKRVAFLVYGVTCYAAFFACFLYSIAFVGNFDIVPKTIDSGTAGPIGVALAINVALLSIFAVQHTGMARPGFKEVWTKIIPEPAERPTYVLLTVVCLVVIYAFWQPIGGTVWEVTNSAGAAALTGLYFFGWAMLLYATALIDHFDLFGLRQAWLAFRGKEYTNHSFATPGVYKHIRHPLYVAWAIIFWATPEMSFGHLLFAVVTTAYMILAVFVEERDLVQHFGDAYRRYQETTPKYLPRFGRKPAGQRATATVTS